VELPKPDAWATVLDSGIVVSATSHSETAKVRAEKDGINVDTLYSSKTINNTIKFQQQARNIEDIGRKLEVAKQNRDWELVLELAEKCAEKADEIAELEEMFSEE